MESKRTRRRWTWLLSSVLVVALTGCGMYPSKPGHWPPNFWGSILKVISDVIDYFAHLFGGSYGLAILVVTIIVRLIILPLFIRQLRYQKMMMELQPEMQKIRSKYKGDNQKIQQETMRLYQEAGTNPAAGCLPMVIQLPVLYALYGAIMGNMGLHESTFLGIFPLGSHDPHYILPVVAGITTFWSSWLSMKNQPSQQRAILFIMPLFIIFIGARLPAGLVLYWVYTNVFTALQTYVFMTRKATPPADGAATAGARPVRSGASGKSPRSGNGSESQKKLASSSNKNSSSNKKTQGTKSAKPKSTKPKTNSPSATTPEKEQDNPSSDGRSDE
ncbi:YidC/Oxa1 family membrane protein insertase [Alicyclobacillus dauci]|uniref:YidC/Oxa1 family membrane protein insertase n=1 Tax=Alicyclobacillus dauci TaxID=1475485 RepID=A0ABY6Z297_9BACL|nr:YidC/Oxa1 family membrane protein insertase [Alicyclobacillus dauci]WAH37005.1 YidC/Oxa1 family membrane protein insertase [Alicyclobacillus dauci]